MYVAGGEDIKWYQSLSIVAAQPGDQVGPHGASTISLTAAAHLGGAAVARQGAAATIGERMATTAA
jgi:hypothetical protein